MTVLLIQSDARHIPLADRSVHCCVTSPPYWGLRDYGVEGQIGLESTPDQYVETMVAVFRDVWRVLRDDGTCWVNLGDSYASETKGSGGGWAADPDNYACRAQAYGARPVASGLRSKNLVGIPWRVAFALQAAGWYLRQDIIWAKPNPMTESVQDRCTKAHEYIFLLAKQPRYYYDVDAVREPAGGWNGSLFTKGKTCHGKHNLGLGHRTERPTKNRRSVWTVPSQPYPGAHFATFPEKLIEPCILAGCPRGGIVLDPFGGSGTTGRVAARHGRKAVLLDLSREYLGLATERVAHVQRCLPL